MKLLLTTIFCQGALTLTLCCLLLVSSLELPAQILKLTKVNEFTLDVSKSGHKTASFPRIFFHQGRNKIYALYAGIKTAATGRSPQDQSIGWLEYDTTFTFTGKAGVLSEPATGGDIAVAFDGSNYYLLIGAPGGYNLYKYNADLALTQKTLVALNKFDSPNDQLLNYTDGRLYLATILGDSATMNNPNVPVYQRWFTYSTSLVAERDTTMKGEPYMVTGGSIIASDNMLQVVTADKFLMSKLYVYQYTSAFKYLGKKLLASDAQWSQGLLYDNGYYYVAYHTGASGMGNVAVGIFDKNWNPVATQAVTIYPSAPGKSGYNAHRPWLMKRGSILYVSYDLASYDATGQENPDWQGKVVLYEVSSTPTSVHETSENENAAFAVTPNPGADFITARFILNRREHVRLALYDILGHEVALLLDSEVDAGEHILPLPVAHYPLSIAFLRLQTSTFSRTEAIRLVR